MNYYMLVEKDHPRQSWALITEEKKTKRPERPPEIPPTVHRLLGQPFPPGLRFKPQYSRYRCKLCRRFDEYEVFDEGFDDGVKIRIKGDFGHTTDRVFVVNDRFVKAIGSVNAQGYELKPLGKSGWHALRVTCLVKVLPGVLEASGMPCPECGRKEYAGGCVQKVSEIAVPESPNTFFASQESLPLPFWDRDIFLTEDLMQAMKSNGIKGGYCYRLYTDEEWSRLKVNPVGIVDDRPRWSLIFL